MRDADLHTQGRRQAEQPAQAQLLPECGRASQGRRARHFGGMPGADVSVAALESGARRYLDAIKPTTNPMRKALLRERAALCLLEEGNLDEALRQAQEAHAAFKEVLLCDGAYRGREAYLGEAQKFRDRFSRMLLSSSKGAVAVEFFD